MKKFADFLLLLKKNRSIVGFLVILLYLSILNIYYLRTTPEVIVIQFGLLTVFFFDVRLRNFFRYWVPFIAVFVAFEFIRGIADDLSPFGDKTLYFIYDLETKLFGTLPTIILQRLVTQNSLITSVLFFFYGMFFYYSFLVGFLIWLTKSSKLFVTYAVRFILLSYVGIACFVLIPTAPPWLVAEKNPLPLTRYIYDSHILKDMKGLSVYGHFIYGNPVAALPSLHTAWPAFTSLFLIQNFKKKWLYLTLIIPFMIGSAVVVTGEHYVIDVVAGWLLGAIFVKINLKHLLSWGKTINFSGYK